MWDYSTTIGRCKAHHQRGVYEIVVGKQPTVGTGLPRPPPMYRPVSPWSSSKRGLIMSFDIFILACGGFLTGRYIGARRDKSGPTAVRIISSKSIICPYGRLLVYTQFIHPSSFLLTIVYWDILNKLLDKEK